MKAELEPLLLTRQQAAEMAGVGLRTIERLLSRGALRKVYPTGSKRCVRVSRKDLERWVDKGCAVKHAGAK